MKFSSNAVIYFSFIPYLLLSFLTHKNISRGPAGAKLKTFLELHPLHPLVCGKLVTVKLDGGKRV